MKRILVLLLSLIFVITFLPASYITAMAKTTEKEVDIYAFRNNITASQIVSEMKIGSNLASYYDMIDFSYKLGYDKRTFSSMPVGVAVWIHDTNSKNSTFEWLTLGPQELMKGEKTTVKVPLKNALISLGNSVKLNRISLGFCLANGKKAKVTASISNAYVKTSEGEIYNLDGIEGKRTYSNFTEDTNGWWFGSYDDNKNYGLPSVKTLRNATLCATIKIDDAPASEITKTDYWINPEGSKTDPFKLVDILQKAGYDSVRLNVSWTPHMNDKTFIIDKDWLGAVQEIVDYILKKDMYVILNSHYDYLNHSWVGDHWTENWMSNEYEDYVNTRFTQMWKQIATRFNQYGDKLLFEVANEMNEEHNTETSLKERVSRVNLMNELFVKTVRSTGSNNTKRFLNIASVSEGAEYLEYLELPEDERLIAQVHYYFTPTDMVWGWNEDTNSVDHSRDKATWKWSNNDEKDLQAIDFVFEKIQNFKDKTGVPVILGEWGSTENYSLNDRINMAKYILSRAKLIGVPCFWWEAAIDETENTTESTMSLYDRNKKKWRQPELLKVIMDVVKD
jgi:endoglucanase